MHGIRAASATANLQRAAAVKKQAPEGSAAEEAAETRAQKAREQQKAPAGRVPPVAPSRNQSGKGVNLVV